MTQIPDSPFIGSSDGSWLLQLAFGRTAAFHLPNRPEAVFYLYIPSHHPISRRARKQSVSDNDNDRTFPLVVTIHGSRRDAETLRDNWSDIAEEQGLVVLSPLFPADLSRPEGIDNYKRLRYNPNGNPNEAIEYDRLLLEMVEYVSSTWGSISIEMFHISGFSGGAQFAHRFWYAHPKRVSAVSMAAPGSIDLPPPLPWPIVAESDTSSNQLAAREIPVLLVVGSDDLLARRQHAKTLYDEYSRRELAVQLVQVQGVGHEEKGLLETMQSFIVSMISSRQPTFEMHAVT